MCKPGEHRSEVEMRGISGMINLALSDNLPTHEYDNLLRHVSEYIRCLLPLIIVLRP